MAELADDNLGASRDALHARVRRICGERRAVRSQVFDDEARLAVVEFPKGVVIVTLDRSGRFAQVKLGKRALTLLHRFLRETEE